MAGLGVGERMQVFPRGQRQGKAVEWELFSNQRVFISPQAPHDVAHERARKFQWKLLKSKNSSVYFLFWKYIYNIYVILRSTIFLPRSKLDLKEI